MPFYKERQMDMVTKLYSVGKKFTSAHIYPNFIFVNINAYKILEVNIPQCFSDRNMGGFYCILNFSKFLKGGSITFTVITHTHSHT